MRAIYTRLPNLRAHFLTRRSPAAILVADDAPNGSGPEPLKLKNLARAILALHYDQAPRWRLSIGLGDPMHGEDYRSNAIEMGSDAEAQAAIAALNGTIIDQQPVSVNEARLKKIDSDTVHSQMRRHREHRY